MTAKIVAFETQLLSTPGSPAVFSRVEAKVTNGVSALTVDISRTQFKSTQAVSIHPDANAAIELAIALLNGAYHVQHGIHAGEFQTPAAFEHVPTAIEVLKAHAKGEQTPRRH